MGGTNKHTSPGSMAGFLFQPERALYWLAKSKDGALIGIETEDDIVIKSMNDEILVREQDKHSISDSIPFGDRSVDLWKTLSIWCKAITANEVDPSIVEFHLVTNKIVLDGLAKKLANSKNEDDSKESAIALLDIAVQLPESMVQFVVEIINMEESLLYKMIQNIVLTDGSANSFGESLMSEVRSLLLVPTDVPFDEVYNMLLGWIHSCALNNWRNKKPAWLKREAFIIYYHRLLERYKIKPFIETAKRMIPVSEDERNRVMSDTFVKQLYLLSIEEKDTLLMEAIDDYLCCLAEKTRFSVEGNLTKQDFDDFDERITERWKLIHSTNRQSFKIKKRKSDDVQSLGEEVGLQILSVTLDHREVLAGQPTEQFYLTRGSYHHLSSELKVGWHPDFKEIFGERELGDNIGKIK
ncbi:hypothetical protein GC096_04040 [Paenibacillus sp. LMG 31461]|uniref:ABC-three component systems C-terminal domain-containing protein n=1 Tax=Paenibacillus plantarum TaxID=2654975 RepID=A0ABX1X483_9BACL|nr:ABC-three component system protein [Paenibacillus plantarum]NOU63217.1 hypothetical protein [Paenibacillus plantarum]